MSKIVFTEMFLTFTSKTGTIFYIKNKIKTVCKIIPS